ncbi:hypothetical protein [Parerythrobacter lacustris]|uniref:Sel1 repeat family protein n=1 Tax=Parerythrobacter lacustris TaxID=2969984 RepID=A0ABT1XQH8_9SPHN|nr:hypothetical protein [Parerythrobacter lacustris]MCR2833919.1 hypothetical protein [Parerythrobacter lacustris]
MNGNAFWNSIYKWEEDFSREWEPWDESEELRNRASEAGRLVKTDPALALQKFSELADEGSAFAMRWAGTLHLGNYGVEENLELAEDFFRRGLCAGSWISTISYASLLFKRGAHDLWPSTLADGIENEYIPAFFWHGWNSYRLHPSKRTAVEGRESMLRAADAGHPGAKAMLARWTARGRFGLRKIPEGIRMLRAAFDDTISSNTTG